MRGAPVEIAGAKVVVKGSVLEHVVDGGEERSSDGTDGLLRATLALQPEELRLVVAVFLSLGRPGALDQHGFQPRCALAQARTLAFSGAFVLTGAHPRPRHQIAGRLEAPHVAADLRKDRQCRQPADARDRGNLIVPAAKSTLITHPLPLHS